MEPGLELGQVYLDAAGAGIYTKSHLDEIHGQLTANLFTNPHSGGITGTASMSAKTELINQLRLLWNISDEYEIIFTQNSSQGIRLAADIINFGQSDLLILLQDNHTSMAGVRQLATRGGAKVAILNLGRVLNPLSAASRKSLELGFKSLLETEKISFLKSTENGSSKINRIIVGYPKQSNFDGRIYSSDTLSRILKIMKLSMNGISEDCSIVTILGMF